MAGRLSGAAQRALPPLMLTCGQFRAPAVHRGPTAAALAIGEVIRAQDSATWITQTIV